MKRLIRSLLCLLFVGILSAPFLARAGDTPAPSPAAAPDIHDYQAPAIDSASLPSVDQPMEAPVESTQTPSGLDPKDKDKDKDWLIKGVAAERKAKEGQQNESPEEKEVDALNALIDPTAPKAAPSTKAPTDPTAIANGTDDSSKDKNPPLSSNSLSSTLKPAGQVQDQFKPLIQGLSSDTIKPIVADAKTPTAADLSQFKSSEAINPDLIRPIYLEDAFSQNASSTSSLTGNTSASFTSSSAISAPANIDLSGLSANSMSSGASNFTAPMAPSAPSLPNAPTAANINPMSSFSMPTMPSIPTAPAAPFQPTAAQIAPQVGSNSVRLKDPVNEIPFQ